MNSSVRDINDNIKDKLPVNCRQSVFQKRKRILEEYNGASSVDTLLGKSSCGISVVLILKYSIAVIAFFKPKGSIF